MRIFERSFRTAQKAFLLTLAVGSASMVMAQPPGDVDGIDIRLVGTGPSQVEVQLRANAPWDWLDGVVNMDFALRWETAAGGTISGFSSIIQSDPCFNGGVKLNYNVGHSNVDDGGFRYRAFNVQGPGWGPDDGCTYPANTWLPFARLNIANLTGCGTFEIVASDAYTQANNINWFISLGGAGVTANSAVVGPGVTLGSAPTPTPGNYGPVCSTAADITLGGTPSGGVWSGTGVSGSGPYVFDPSVGTQTLTYTITQGGCQASANTTITVGTCDCNGDIGGTAFLDNC
ncbi:MAG: hypothetical protein KDB84_10300, partial [Flavobacteriales bacterium]|nr:hypothetical protein [Flavobacteriales bacterium]